MDLDLNEPIEPEDEKETSRARRRRSRRKVISPLTPDEKTEFIEGVLRKASPTFDFFLFSLLAGSVIGLGFLLDSVYILVLGALFAPIMGPLVGISLGIILGSGKHFIRSLGGFLVGSFLVIVGGALAGLLSRLFPTFETNISHQFVQLGWPAFLVLAIGAVFTTAFIVRERRHPGVASAAISFGLFLPLAAAGFGLGSGIPHLWPDGLVLFLIHLSWAALAGAITLAIMGFKPLTLFGYSIGGAVALLAVILVLAFFSASFVFSGDLAQPTPTFTLAPTQTPTLTPSSTPVPPTATLTPSLTPTATLTPTPTFTPSPTPVEARVNANSGIVIREAPNGESLVVSRAANGSIIQLIGPVETDQFGREWLLVLDINTNIEGWVLSGLVITATPVVEATDTPTLTPVP